MKTETMATEASMAGKFFARTYEPDEVVIEALLVKPESFKLLMLAV
jgi:hypothetical protein